MSDDSGRSEAKRRLPPGRNHGYGGDMDKRLRTHDGAYRRMRSQSNERGYDIDDGPSTSSSSSRRHFPFSSTSANSSENDEYARQRTRRMSPRPPSSMSHPAFAAGIPQDAPPPLNRMWTDRGTPRERISHPGPPDAIAIDRSTGDRMPSPPGLTLSSGQPIVGPPLKTQAAFVGKLYSMLEDEEIRQSGLLHWSNNGTTFICPNPTEFSKAILPRFFKHNNWQSFVRQLNMYSFNKVHCITTNTQYLFHFTMELCEADAKVNDLYATSNDPAAWEFRHPLFRQGEPHFLASIKRKTTRNNNSDGHPMLSPSEEFGEARMLGGSMTGYGVPPSGSGPHPPGTPGAHGVQPAWMPAGPYPPHPGPQMPVYGDPLELRDPREHGARDSRGERDSRDMRSVRDIRDGRDARESRALRESPDPREPRDASRESRSGGNQVFGIDLKTGKTIESRPYEQTARASTREYFESLRPGSSGGPPAPPHPGHAEPHSRAAEPSREHHEHHPYYGNIHRERERDRFPPPLSAPPRPIRERDLPQGPEMPPHTPSYPQPSSRFVPNSMPSSAMPQGVPMSEVDYLHDKIARLRDALTEQTLEGLRREMEAVRYSWSLIDWVANAPVHETRNVQHGLSQRVADLRNEYEAVASRPPAAHMDMGRADRHQQNVSISHSARASQATESSLHRSSTSTNPVTPLIAHTPLPFSRSSGTTRPPVISGSISAPVSASLSSSISNSNGSIPLPPPSAGVSPALRKLPLPRPSLESRPSLELRSLPGFPHGPRDSMTSPLAFEYIPNPSSDEVERRQGEKRNTGRVGERQVEVKRELDEHVNVGQWRGQRDQRDFDASERGRPRQARHNGQDYPPSPRPTLGERDEERRLQSPVSPKTTSTSRFTDMSRPDGKSAPVTSPGAYGASDASRSRGQAERPNSTHSSKHSNGRAPSRSPREVKGERSKRDSRSGSSSAKSDGSATSAHALTSPLKTPAAGARGVSDGSIKVKSEHETEGQGEREGGDEGAAEDEGEETPTKAPAPTGMRNLLN